MNTTVRSMDSLSPFRKSALGGAYLGLCWGLFTWAAIAAVQSPPPLVALAEVILNVIAWASIAALIHKASNLLVHRSRLDKKISAEDRPGIDLLVISAIFLAVYANYYLHPFLIAGLYLISPAGIAASLGISLLVILPILLVVRRRSCFFAGIESRLYMAPLLAGGMFVFGRVYLSSLHPGSGRLPIALILYSVASLVFALIVTRRPARSRFPVGLFAVPLVLVVVAAVGTIMHDFEAMARDDYQENDQPPVTIAGAPVILISLDTVRRDHLSLYGYSRLTSPNLDRFAEDAIVFDRSYANSSWTLSSHASLFTGLYPSEHGLHYPIAAAAGIPPAPLSPGIATLSSVFADHGYRTVAIASNRLSVSPEYGLDRGFQQVFADRRMTDRPMPFTFLKAIRRVIRIPLLIRLTRTNHDAEAVTDRAIYWLENRRPEDQPFLLFLNYLDPHNPYAPPKTFSERLRASPPSKGWLERIRTLYYRKRNRRVDLADWERAILSNSYDGEIAHMDDHLGRLIEYLEDREWLNRAWIVLFSDHGEFLGEHRRVGHGKALYEEVTRTVLVVRPPGGVSGGRREDRLISLLELPSMLLRGSGIPVPAAMAGGDSLISRPVIAEKFLTVRDRHYGSRNDVGLLQTIWWDRWKWIIARPGNTEELFDLEADPSESENLAEREQEVREVLSIQFRSWLETVTPSGTDSLHGQDGRKERSEQLRALGYLQ